MSAYAERAGWEPIDAIEVPDTMEFEELQNRVASLEKQNKTLAATVLDLWEVVTELRGII